MPDFLDINDSEENLEDFQCDLCGLNEVDDEGDICDDCAEEEDED